MLIKGFAWSAPQYPESVSHIQGGIQQVVKHQTVSGNRLFDGCDAGLGDQD